ncbi:MAG: hypothetical protein WKG32_20870 [Gemmatimonadaceae bacterium]
MRGIVGILMLAAALALATVVAGWWGVPLAAFAWGVMARSGRRAASSAALAGALAWSALLLWQATRGPVGTLASRVAGAMQLPAPALVALTLLFPALLAWGATVIGQALAARLGRGRV